MAVGVEDESERKGGIALYVPANDGEPSSVSSASPPPRLPSRLRRRLMESKAPSTAEEIEAKLQKADLRRQAKRQRGGGYLMERRRICDVGRVHMKGVPKQDPTTIIARLWRSFVQMRKTTVSLAKAFQALDISEESVKSMEFEQLASKINATATVLTVRALLVRLESRLVILKTTSGNEFSMEKVDHLLKRVGLHGRSSNQVTKTSRSETIGSRKATKGPSKLSRYPAKVVLFAYMILGHPETVFIGKSEFENALLDSASKFVQDFELLIKIILEGPLRTLHEDQRSTPSFRSQLEMFDKRWCSYLHHFVAWKDKDAIFFEENMKGVARQLQLFMAQTSKLTLEGDNSNIAHDIQVSEEQKILRSDKQQLGSSENYLSVAGSSSPELDTVYSPEVRQAESSKSERHTNSSKLLVTENELVANEIVHDYHHFLSVSSHVPAEAENSLKAKLKETMEKAFWDGIMESMEEDEPDFSWVVKVLKEVRDELCEMSPSSWRSEIAENIDIEILSQILNSGTLDVGYFKQILDFSVVTLRKLSAPAKEKELEVSYQKLMEELGDVSCSGESLKPSFALLMVKGLRFVLHQIQNLKEEIANAHLRMVEPLIKSPAGLEYLKSSFSKRCGSPADASTSLPLTRQWLSSVRPAVELEWKEYSESVATAISKEAVQPEILPATIRTGGSSLIPSKISSASGISVHGKEQPECKGERLDLLIRVGLLKLVNQIRGLSSDTLPETLKLNLARLRLVQSRLQKIIVISTSLLVMRQILFNEKLVSNSSEVDSMLSTCANRLCNLLDTIENAGILEIVEALCSVLVDHDSDPEKLQTRKQIIANMLIKSLQEGDLVYTRVSRNIYLAMRGLVLGGNGRKGRKLAEAALLPIGAVALTEKVVEAAEVLVVMAVVSVIVHGDWYRELIKNW